MTVAGRILGPSTQGEKCLISERSKRKGPWRLAAEAESHEGNIDGEQPLKKARLPAMPCHIVAAFLYAGH